MATSFFTLFRSNNILRADPVSILARRSPIGSSVIKNQGRLRPQLALSFKAWNWIPRNEGSFTRRFLTATGVFGIGIGLSAYSGSVVACESAATITKEQSQKDTPFSPPVPPQSSVLLYELGFGTVAGMCAGIFVKKGAKLVAWALGGVFVLLQFLGSSSVVRVNWGEVGSRFENLFYSRDAAGGSRPPTVLSLWNWLINFLTADFQPRASFIAGFALGLRIG